MAVRDSLKCHMRLPCIKSGQALDPRFRGGEKFICGKAKRAPPCGPPAGILNHLLMSQRVAAISWQVCSWISTCRCHSFGARKGGP